MNMFWSLFGHIACTVLNKDIFTWASNVHIHTCIRLCRTAYRDTNYFTKYVHTQNPQYIHSHAQGHDNIHIKHTPNIHTYSIMYILSVVCFMRTYTYI
jgi:hypothetical protein